MNELQDKYKLDIGLEVHVRLVTSSKIFSTSENSFGKKENTSANFVDLALPGTLPTINRHAVIQALKLGMILKCQIADAVHMDRKHYFYPDMPKGYQITQMRHPLLAGGYITLDCGKPVRLKQVHLEEDAAKLMHRDGRTEVDYNRCGLPLVEVVTECDMHSVQEVVNFLSTLKTLLSQYDISESNMEKGELKVDVNVSVRPVDSSQLGTRCEIKNMNSISSIVQAVNYEFDRQSQLLEKGEQVEQHSLTFNVKKMASQSMRVKESAYRYLPEFDIPPLVITEDMLHEARSCISKMSVVQVDFQLSQDKRDTMLKYPKFYPYFLEIKNFKPTALAYQWVYVNLLSFYAKCNVKFSSQLIPTHMLLKIMDLVEKKEIDPSSFFKIAEQYVLQDISLEEIVDNLNLRLLNDTCILKDICNEVINMQTDPSVGKDKKSLSYLIGRVKCACHRKYQRNPNPVKVASMLKELIQKREEGE